MSERNGASPNGAGASPNGTSAPLTGTNAPPNGVSTTPKRIQGAENRRGPGGGPPWMGAAMPAEKSVTFWPSAKRLLGRLQP